MSNKVHHTFEAPEQFHVWLRENHASETELWVRIFKKATGQPSVTWDDCVVAAIEWGWIDGVRNALDDTSYLQRPQRRHGLSEFFSQCKSLSRGGLTFSVFKLIRQI
jgi:uncharacterized protein YdeI (YjbR/CyaY-like superfamily)